MPPFEPGITDPNSVPPTRGGHNTLHRSQVYASAVSIMNSVNELCLVTFTTIQLHGLDTWLPRIK